MPDENKSTLDKVNEVAEKLNLLEPRVAALITGSILMVKGIGKLLKQGNAAEAGPYIEEASKFADALEGLGADIEEYNREFRPEKSAANVSGQPGN